MNYRIGQGFDAHQLVEGHPLIIAGVDIPYTKGSKGHSDGDVLYHAIVDALLGALALGDIGQHFPSSDKKWKNAQSSLFVEHAVKLLQSKGHCIANIDATIILQKPYLVKYILDMKSNISTLLSIVTNNVSIKATTTDYLGFIGRSDGIAASAIVLLKEI